VRNKRPMRRRRQAEFARLQLLVERTQQEVRTLLARVERNSIELRLQFLRMAEMQTRLDAHTGCTFPAANRRAFELHLKHSKELIRC